MGPCILVDTNVWLDVYIPGRPGAQAANELIEEASRQGAHLVFPSHACLDVFCRVSFEHKRWVRESSELTEAWAVAIKRYAWDCVNDLRKIATAVPVDSSDLYLACKHRDAHDDLEDDLVLAACQRAHANYLVTNDRKLLRHSPVETKTPSAMVGLLRSGLANVSGMTTASHDATYWMYQWLGSMDGKRGG